MNKLKRARTFAMNAALLCTTSLIMQSVSMTFNIYISNKIGAEGIGLFTLIMSVYGLAVTFATSGVHLASVRLVSEAMGSHSDKQVLASLRRCFTYSLLFSITTAFAVFYSADYIGRVWLADIRTIRSIKVLALELPFVSAVSVMSGYFSASRRVIKSASAQILEELAMMTIVAGGLYFFLPKGIEYACLCIIAGSVLSQIISFLYLLVLFLFDLRKHNDGSGNIPPALTRTMLKITLPVAFTAYARSGLSTIKNLLVPYGLKKNGADSVGALEAYGILTGMAFPVIMFPQVIISSFSGLLVPEITKSRVEGHYNNIRYIITRVFHIVTVFAIGVCGILLCFSHELGELIYCNEEVSLYIKLMAPLIPFLYIDGIVDATLNGLDEQVRSMEINLIDSIISIVLVWFLLPRFGTFGYIMMLYACKGVNSLLSFLRLYKVSGFRPQPLKWLVKPGVSIAVSVLLVRLLGNIFSMGIMGNVIVKIILSVTVYLLLIRITGCVDKEDWIWMKEIILGK